MTHTERKIIEEVHHATRMHLKEVDRLLKLKMWKSNPKAHDDLVDVAVGLDISEDKLGNLFT